MILSGTALADAKLQTLKETIAARDAEPRLVVIQVGDDPASTIYVNRKQKIAADIGIALEIIRHESATTEQLIAEVETLNAREDVDAILIQIPLPPGIDTDRVISAMDPAKDVDGFHPNNIRDFMQDEPVHTPVLLQAIDWLLEATEEDYAHKKAVIIGKSDIFLQPLGHLLERRNMRVTEIKPEQLATQQESKDADVLIVAVGMPFVIGAAQIKPGATVIDIGINRTTEGKVVGDVDYRAIETTAAHVTPTPGGVGPVTIAALMWNTFLLSENRQQ